MSRRHRPRTAASKTETWRSSAAEPWTRRRLQVLLVASMVVVLALVVGGVWAIVRPLGDNARDTRSTPHAEASAGSSGSAASQQDQLASSPLASASLQQAQGGTLAAQTTRPIVLPAPTAVDAVGVSTGFPRSPVGAMAQLIEIDRRALESASVVTAQRVIDAWAEPGGPSSQTWSGVQAVMRLLSAAGLPAEGSGDLQVSLRPAMGLIKGSVGADFVVPCVDFVATITATGARAQRVAVADCQRMRWTGDGDGWRVAAGSEPAPAPSIWPGTQTSYDAGYRWLESAP